MTSRFMSRFARQARLLPLFAIAAGTVSLALQSQGREAIANASPVGRVNAGQYKGIRLQHAFATDTIGRPEIIPIALSPNTPDEAMAAQLTSATPGPSPTGIDTAANVKTFGAIGDGKTNDTAAFNAALTSLATRGGVCLVPTGTYLISAAGIAADVSSGVHFVGEGRGQSILKIAGMPVGPRSFLTCVGDNWSVQNLTFDMQGFVPSVNLSAMSCKGNNWIVENCEFTRIGVTGIAAFGGKGWSVKGNYFSTNNKASPTAISSAPLQPVGKPVDPVVNARILDNVCEGAGISFNGRHSLISRNRVSGSVYGSGILTGTQPGTDAAYVIENTCTGGHGRDANKTWVTGFELWAPNSVVANNTSSGNDGGGMAVGGRNSIVIGNRCFNNGAGQQSSGITARWLNNGPNNASGSMFLGNVCFDDRPAGHKTQGYGYSEQGNAEPSSPLLTHITHIGNNYGPNKLGKDKYNSAFGDRNVSKTEVSPATLARVESKIRDKVKAITDTGDGDMSDTASRPLREYLRR